MCRQLLQFCVLVDKINIICIARKYDIADVGR